MNREIKYRVWDKCDNRMLSCHDIKHRSNSNLSFGYWYLFNRQDVCIPMQFTGLKDKNGVEIYEGDVVKCVSLKNDHNQFGATDIQVVRFFSGNFVFSYGNNETGVPIWPLIISLDCEVIGNIFQNPELLKQA